MLRMSYEVGSSSGGSPCWLPQPYPLPSLSSPAHMLALLAPSTPAPQPVLTTFVINQFVKIKGMLLNSTCYVTLKIWKLYEMNCKYVVRLTCSSSTSILTKTTSLNLEASSFKKGSMVRQGPHHVAVKSITIFNNNNNNNNK